jgi:hypothetical protein
MLEILTEYVREGVTYLRQFNFIRIFAHYDADGIASAAILARALLREGKRFHIQFLKRLDVDFAISLDPSSDELLLFADMGSGHGDAINALEGNVMVVDHHYPRDSISCLHINPYLGGIDGSYEISAAGTCYLLAKELGDNLDLSALALVGAIGDKQKITGANEIIVKDGIRKGFIEFRGGVPLYSMSVYDALKLSTEPYLGFHDDDSLNDFLTRLHVDGTKHIDSLDDGELRTLNNAIALRVLKMNAYPDIMDELLSKNYYIPREIINNATMFTDVLNACGRMGLYGIGLGLALGDRNFLEQGIQAFKTFQYGVIKKIGEVENLVQEGTSIRYLLLNNSSTTGPIATVLSRYKFADRPFLVLNVKKDVVKCSIRGNLRLVESGLDLGLVMREAANYVGGSGGGHNVASAAVFSPGKEEEFIAKVDELCQKWLKSQ